VTVIVRSNRGETRSFSFDTLKKAIAFLDSTGEEQLIDVSTAPALSRESHMKKRILKEASGSYTTQSAFEFDAPTQAEDEL
jgi:hypothetical protein